MRIPEAVRRGVERALGAGRPGADEITDAVPIGGGCISPAARIRTADGRTAFLKWAGADGPGARMFTEEARSLRALADAGAIRVPDVLGVSPSDAGADESVGTTVDPEGSTVVRPAEPDRSAGGSTAWLLLEWLEPGPASDASWRALGRGLARLHRTPARAFGWPADNYIGSLPQPNAASEDWPSFWRDRRLAPQLRMARDGGYFDASERARFDRLLDRLDELLDGAAADGASLVHGDLWSGNVHMLADGSPALIDPAAYHGHREVDLAMSELFGGFTDAFYRAYDDEWPLEPGYAERRRPVYQLYYLLVHVNLFGGGYVGRTLSALRAAERG